MSLSIRRNIGAALWLVTYGDDGAERDEVGHYRDDVDDVHQRPEEGEVVGRRGEPQRDLGREPDHARRLDEEERLVERRDVVARNERCRLHTATTGSQSGVEGSKRPVDPRDGIVL